jgi:hypothetical protein
MQAPVTHILPLTTIRRERLLPAAGRVVVRAGQKVEALDVVAEGSLEGGHVLLDVRRGLGISAEQADEIIERKIGEEISQGDVIAGPVGLIPRVIRAPKDGRIVAIGGGQVLLETQDGLLELRAGIPGTVVDLVPDRGAVIEGTGALIQAVWGNGHMDVGMLTVLLEQPTDELTVDRVDVSLRGAVVLGGYCGQADVLQTAAELPLRGLILASLAGALAPLAARLPIPIVVLEGFGRIPMNPQAYKILTTNDKREVTVNAEPMDAMRGTRPEVIIPLPATSKPPLPRDTDIFAPGQTVRILRAPYAGMTGKIISLKSGLASFPGGNFPAAMVELEGGEQTAVPLANMEIIA